VNKERRKKETGRRDINGADKQRIKERGEGKAIPVTGREGP
jgi:hypothetical protein